jgi:hypothetical protein
MAETVSRGDRQAYVTAVADLWERLGRALARLERIADAPEERVGGDVADELSTLQYNLHAGAEMALGIDPPPRAQSAHLELVDALGQARDATADVGAALRSGEDDVAESLLPEWRGALFRVRLARLRILDRSPFPFPSEEGIAIAEPGPTGRRIPALALAATGLVIAGAFLFTAGAVLAAWPVWAAGLLLFAGGFILLRP